MSDAIETQVGYWANFYHVPAVRIDTSNWTDEQVAAFVAELQRECDEAMQSGLVDASKGCALTNESVPTTRKP